MSALGGAIFGLRPSSSSFIPAAATSPHIRDLETVEAEVAYLVLKCGQWPAFQTEIHPYSSQVAHSPATTAVVAHVRNAR